MTERARLTDALALAARPREREHAIHDTALQGFMLRVQPNGARSWVFALIDAKTGPRHVLLGDSARELLDELAETASGEWVFPSGKGNGPLSTNNLWAFWTTARDAAAIVADARPHDRRHAHASHAAMNGESLHITGRLLGHRTAYTTNRYVHLDDATLNQAAERVPVAIKLKFQSPNSMSGAYDAE